MRFGPILLCALWFVTECTIADLSLRGQERNVTLHTNFFYWGPIKETFSAYHGKDGKLVKHGRYRDWEEDGSLWHEIDWPEIPVLLDWINSDRSDAGVEVAYRELSRPPFGWEK
jgi:hypothetical protein